ncbi:ATP-binding cassette subfamily B protein [Streptomyces ambofaciens]
MGTTETRGPAPGRSAVLLALRHYGRELLRLRRLALPALLLPAVGNIGIRYVAPLLIAKLAGQAADEGGLTVGPALPYVLGFGVTLLLAEAVWRVGQHCLNRVDALGMEHLYVRGMDELLAKDAAFFHDNFAGSLTKRVLSYGKRFEDFVDTVTYRIVGSLVPLLFGAVVLWSYEPMLVVGLFVMIALTVVAATPLIRRRQRLVNDREAAIARVSGHVADSLMNMETIRAFAAERREAAEHRSRVADSRRLTLRSWDYGNLRVDTLIAPMSVLTNVLGLLVAIAFGGPGQGVEEVVVAFTYYSNATQIMFEFNQIYRRLESSMTEAAQFTELLLDPPTVLDADAPEPLAPRDTGIRFEEVTFAHTGTKPLFRGLGLDVPAGARIGLVGRSGGGKTTLTRLLLRMSDIDHGRILIGGQDISRLRQSDLRSLIAYVPQEPAMFHRSLRDNIAFARPGATEEEIRAAAAARARHGVRRTAPRRLRHAGGGERGQAVRRPAPARRPGQGRPARRPDPAARRGDQRPGLGERTPRPGRPVAADGRTYGPRGRPPSEHRRRDGPPRRPRPRTRRGAGHPPGTARDGRRLRQAVAAPVGRLPRRERRVRERRVRERRVRERPAGER